MPDEGRPLPLIEPGFSFCPACGASLDAPRPVTCASCGVTHWRNAKPCAGALVVDDGGRLLLVRRAIEPYHGDWDIPGGFCDADEHPRDAAVREVSEEVGLAVRITGFLGMWMDRYGGEGAETTLNHYFLARPAGGTDLRIDPAESNAADWFAPDALPERIAFPDHARSVLAAWLTTVAGGGDAVTASDTGS